MLRAVVLCELLVCTCACATSPPAIPPLADPARYASTAFSREFEFSSLGSSDPSKTRGGANTQAAAMVGRDDLTVAENGETLGRRDCPALPGDPVAEIVRRARITNIVIINETHDRPHERYFIGEVLKALKPLGYTTYAAETFHNGPDLNHPLVLTDDGFYSQEPIFGRIVAEAKALGYRFVGYEVIDAQENMDDLNRLPLVERINRRDALQTENLMAAIFRNHPDEKVIIHVGEGHATERARPGQPKWMAQRLAEATGRDPLTIGQTVCLSPSGKPALVQGPDDGEDLYIGHPLLDLKNGRPAWRQQSGDVVTPLPAALLPKGEPLLIEARLVDAPMDTVAIDRLLLRPGEALPLLLPPGRYRLDVSNAKGELTMPSVIVNAHK